MLLPNEELVLVKLFNIAQAKLVSKGRGGARILLRRSEFESRWGPQFFCKIVIEKNENKQKRGRGWPIFKKVSYEKVRLLYPLSVD